MTMNMTTGIVELDTFYANLCLCSRPVVDESVRDDDDDDDDASSLEHSLDVTQTRTFYPSWLKHLHALNVGDHHGSTDGSALRSTSLEM